MHQGRSLLLVALPALFVGAGCQRDAALVNPGAGADLAAPPFVAGDLATAADRAGDLAVACRADKIRFPQDTGCANDGSVEFCIPAGDAVSLAAVRAIAPQLHCAPGGGRAGCNSTVELLCTFPTGDAECVTQNGALNDAAWAELCRLSDLPFIREIVRTILE